MRLVDRPLNKLCVFHFLVCLRTSSFVHFWLTQQSHTLAFWAKTWQLRMMLRERRRGDMIELFFTKAVGLPAEFVAPMRQSPFWATQEVFAPTLVNDAILMGHGSFTLPKERIAKVTLPTLVIDGGTTPWLSHAADAVADTLPNAQRRTITGQPHNVDPQALAPVLVEFFTA